MTTLADLIKRDSIEAHWFWVDSINAGPYAENEQFDVTLVRKTGYVVGGGVIQRRTLHFRGVQTAQADSMRKNGGRIIEPDLTEVLGGMLRAAADIDNYPVIRDWVDATQDTSRGYLAALDDLEAREADVRFRDELRAWLGDSYDEYMSADRG